ncbi:hypothetical protein IG193_08570 [Infirmifilum lucidum]|uniref:DUF8196 domain-containing protein n=1 Tax=Infirmifilum lucidum TaxID=2776706 RepID=A0A7L9FIQ7_9CREN|nr:hypothetical protein [Infirmifilum lucidum]QOJ78786.1 hypothetical protein IG193_08570 [Infirmifilum lucidum]
MGSLEEQFLELLKKDEKFRLAVASYLGYDEILRRLREHDEKFNAILGEIKLLREDQKKLWENQNKLWENANRLWEEVKSLREGQERLWEEVKSLRESQGRLWEEVRALREGQGRLWEEVRALREGQSRIATTLERLTLSVEEEALEVVGYRLEKELGVRVELSRVFVDGEELDIYGASGDLCVLGEATVRLGVGLVEELERKVELVRAKRPELLRRKLIKVIYADYATPEALRLAEERGIWVLKWSGDLTQRKIHEV